MRCTEEYLDGLLARETITITAKDNEKLAGMGFRPERISDGTATVTDLMLRCPVDKGHRWRFYIAVADNGDGTGTLYGFRSGLMSFPYFEYREFYDMARMSKYNADTQVYDWMVQKLREMVEQDAVTPSEAVA